MPTVASTAVIKGELIGVDDPRWRALLRRVPHDFYHLPEYVAFTAPYDGGEPAALWLADPAGQALLLPLIIRHIPDGGLDAISPYGYAGPLVVGPTAFRRSAMSYGYGVLEGAGIVSLFVRLHPLLDQDVDDLPGALVRHGETVLIDLSLPEARQWGQIRKTHRHQIERAEALGFESSIDVDLRHLPAFGRLYRATMKRRRAGSYYLFDDAYFEGLATALKGRLTLCVVEKDDVLCAAGLFVETDGIVESHLSADDRALSKGGVKKLVYDRVRRWAKARGNRWFHLGGGVGGQTDSLFHFKAGYSPLRRPFRSLRAVTREGDYRRLVEGAGGARDVEPTSGFFPPYRDT